MQSRSRLGLQLYYDFSDGYPVPLFLASKVARDRLRNRLAGVALVVAERRTRIYLEAVDLAVGPQLEVDTRDRQIERRSEQGLRFREGTLYPALHAMERDGWIAGRWETPGGGPARKVYTITEAGLAELARRTRSWTDFARSVNRVLEGGPDVQPA